MQIVSLTAENFKRLRAVLIEPKGGLVQVTGRNAQGKSSVLDAIAAALLGKDACPSDPIRHGETSATVKLDLGEVVVTRKFTPSGSTLTLTNSEGAKFSSPQKMLDSLLGALTFDPLEFTRLRPRDQFDQLKAVAKVELDLDQLDGLNSRDFDRRTDLNREAKQLRAQLEGLPAPVPNQAPAELRDMAALVQQVQDLSAMRLDAVHERDERQRLQNEVDRKRAEIETLRQRAIALQAEVKELLPQLEAPLATQDPETFDAEIASINESIRTAQRHNEAVAQARQQAQRRKELEAQAKAKEEQAQQLTEAMEARQRAKEEALAAAAFPVAGLSLGDGQVLLNGVPLSQASSAEQLRVSTALAMAANPQVQVVLIREGSLLDEDSLHMVAQMAAAKGYQVWIEKVDSSRSVGVVIEDGAVLVDHQACSEEGEEVSA